VSGVSHFRFRIEAYADFVFVRYLWSRTEDVVRIRAGVIRSAMGNDENRDRLLDE
jgi:hypothetical protein